MKKARVVNGVVKKVIELDKLGLLPPNIQAEFIDCPDETEAGGLYDGVGFSKPLPSPAEAAVAQLKKISNSCDAELSALKHGYPESEIATWGKQEAEARAYQADPQASTPFITSLSAERGVTVAELVSRIINKADQWINASATIIGKRQRLEDQVSAILAANALPTTNASYINDDTARAMIKDVVWYA